MDKERKIFVKANGKRFQRVRLFFFRVLMYVMWHDLVLNRPILRLFRTDPIPRWTKLAATYREIAIEMGGVLIKLGQFLSVRVDILPQEVTDELSGLQDKVAEEAFESIIAEIENDLGVSVSDYFSEISPKPLGAASLAQVHAGRHHSGEKVAIKVLRPGIEGIVESDLKAFAQAVKWLKSYRPIRRVVNLDRFAEEFSTVTRNELDLRLEAENAVRFARALQSNKTVYVPKIYPGPSGKRVLTLEYVAFIKVDNKEALQNNGIAPASVARALFHTHLEQIFVTNYVHVDSHPGNLFVKPIPGGGFQLVYVDFGMMAEIPEALRSSLTDYAIGIGTRNPRMIVDAYRSAGLLLPHADQARIESSTADVLDRFSNISMQNMKNVAMAEAKYFVNEYRDLIYEAPIQFPVDLLFIFRSVGILSGVTTRLYPGFSPLVEVIPFATKLAQEKISGNTPELLIGNLSKLQKLLTLPFRVEQVLSQAESGKLTINSNPAPGSTQMIRRLERSNRKMTFVIAGAGFLVAGSLGIAPTLGWIFMAGAIVLSIRGVVQRTEHTL